MLSQSKKIRIVKLWRTKQAASTNLFKFEAKNERKKQQEMNISLPAGLTLKIRCTFNRVNLFYLNNVFKKPY